MFLVFLGVGIGEEARENVAQRHQQERWERKEGTHICSKHPIGGCCGVATVDVVDFSSERARWEQAR